MSTRILYVRFGSIVALIAVGLFAYSAFGQQQYLTIKNVAATPARSEIGFSAPVAISATILSVYDVGAASAELWIKKKSIQKIPLQPLQENSEEWRGSFSVKNLPVGTYQIIVSAQSKQKGSRAISSSPIDFAIVERKQTKSGKNELRSNAKQSAAPTLDFIVEPDVFVKKLTPILAKWRTTNVQKCRVTADIIRFDGSLQPIHISPSTFGQLDPSNLPVEHTSGVRLFLKTSLRYVMTCENASGQTISVERRVNDVPLSRTQFLSPARSATDFSTPIVYSQSVAFSPQIGFLRESEQTFAMTNDSGREWNLNFESPQGNASTEVDGFGPDGAWYTFSPKIVSNTPIVYCDRPALGASDPLLSQKSCTWLNAARGALYVTPSDEYDGLFALAGYCEKGSIPDRKCKQDSDCKRPGYTSKCKGIVSKDAQGHTKKGKFCFKVSLGDFCPSPYDPPEIVDVKNNIGIKPEDQAQSISFSVRGDFGGSKKVTLDPLCQSLVQTPITCKKDGCEQSSARWNYYFWITPKAETRLCVLTATNESSGRRTSVPITISAEPITPYIANIQNITGKKDVGELQTYRFDVIGSKGFMPTLDSSCAQIAAIGKYAYSRDGFTKTFDMAITPNRTKVDCVLTPETTVSMARTLTPAPKRIQSSENVPSHTLTIQANPGPPRIMNFVYMPEYSVDRTTGGIGPLSYHILKFEVANLGNDPSQLNGGAALYINNTGSFLNTTCALGGLGHIRYWKENKFADVEFWFPPERESCFIQAKSPDGGVYSEQYNFPHQQPVIHAKVYRVGSEAPMEANVLETIIEYGESVYIDYTAVADKVSIYPSGHVALYPHPAYVPILSGWEEFNEKIKYKSISGRAVRIKLKPELAGTASYTIITEHYGFGTQTKEVSIQVTPPPSAPHYDVETPTEHKIEKPISYFTANDGSTDITIDHGSTATLMWEIEEAYGSPMLLYEYDLATNSEAGRWVVEPFDVTEVGPDRDTKYTLIGTQPYYDSTTQETKFPMYEVIVRLNYGSDPHQLPPLTSQTNLDVPPGNACSSYGVQSLSPHQRACPYPRYPTVPYYSQLDTPTSNYTGYGFPGKACRTMRQNGCGPTSLAMVLSYWRQQQGSTDLITPIEASAAIMAAQIYPCSKECKGCDTYHHAFTSPAILKDFGLKGEQLGNIMTPLTKEEKKAKITLVQKRNAFMDKIIENLLQGRPIIASMRGNASQSYNTNGEPVRNFTLCRPDSPFTTGGHIIVLTGYNSSEKVFAINDPYNKSYCFYADQSRKDIEQWFQEAPYEEVKNSIKAAFAITLL